MKNVAVLTGDGAFALFFHPHRAAGDLTAQESPPPGNLPSKAKKILMPGVSPGGGGWLGAAGIDWCIILTKITFCPKAVTIIKMRLWEASGRCPSKINPSIPPRSSGGLHTHRKWRKKIRNRFYTRETSARLLEIGRRKRASRMLSGESIFAFLNTMTVPAELLLVMYWSTSGQ